MVTYHQDLSINVTPLSITTTSLPSGSIGQVYNQAIHTKGGIAPLNFCIIRTGSLPLNLNQSTGVISGTPILPVGTSSFTVRVQDAAAQSATKALSITISLFNVPNITTTTLQGGTVGQAYNQTLHATGGLGTLTWSVTSGSLPAGLTLSSAGTISGTPATAENSNFTVTATDTFGQSDTQGLSIAVSAALAITTTSLPNAKQGEALQYNLAKRLGQVSNPVSWSVNPPLPSGLILNASTGQITGTQR